MFVDTSAWYAAYVPTDPHNTPVCQLLSTATESIVTTDYVIDETITLLSARGERQRANSYARDLLIVGTALVEKVLTVDLVQAVQILAKYQDNGWSFTDCTSFAVMQRLSINAAISLDKHFRQMPGISVYP